MQFVESYKFWDIAALWARERGEDEVAIARTLAHGVIVDGLRMESVDPRWLVTNHLSDGFPHVGYCATPTALPARLRIKALEHLLAVTRQGESPSREILVFEFVFRNDFRAWLQTKGQQLPGFWFTDMERTAGA